MTSTPTNYPKSLVHRTASELLTYPPHVLAALRYAWDLWALPHQVIPSDGRFGTICIGGRASGKTSAASQWIRDGVYKGVRRMAFIGLTAQKIRDDMVRGEAGILGVFPPHQKPEYIASQARVVFHTGAEALLFTAQKPEKLQGANLERVWLDEASNIQNLEEVWNQMVFACRVGTPEVCLTTNAFPENEFLKRLVEEAESRNLRVIKSSSYDNFANLPDTARAQIIEMAKTAYGRAMIYPEFWSPEGALWKKEWFKHLPQAPAGGRVVIGVDPAGTTHGDETGIVVAKRVGDFGYIIDDLSGHYSAEEWPRKVVEAHKKYKSSAVVIETNRGLNFLGALIRPLDRSIPLKEVHTAKSKDDRALPIAALYERGQIFHCPMLPKLEAQMVGWDPKSIAEQRRKRLATSPDRLDAAVYALSELRFDLGLAPKFVPLDVRLPSNSF